MAGFLNDLGFLYSLIEVGQGGQIVYIQTDLGGYLGGGCGWVVSFGNRDGCRHFNIMSALHLLLQEIFIQLKNRTFPFFAAVSSFVGAKDGFFLRFRVFDAFSKKFILNLGSQTVIQHIDLILDRDRRILLDVAFYSQSVYQTDQFGRLGCLGSGCIVDAGFAIFESFHKSAWI